VRQLSNALRAAAVLAAGQPQIEWVHVPEDVRDEAVTKGWTPEHTAPARTLFGPEGLPAAPPHPERDSAPTYPGLNAHLTLAQVLEQAGGNVSEAARRLGLSRNTLYRKLRQTRPG
jgi:transcriptional regulator of acetoin/glycerol metabolism